MDLLDYYRDNLSYLRGLSAEFAAEFPKIARRLLLSEYDCQDPYIERLLEGTAFLSAKVEKKLDDGYYPFLEAVLGSIAPNALYPVPSGAVLEMSPNMSDENVRKGAFLNAGTFFDTVIPGINTPCRFSTAVDMPLLPFTVSAAEYTGHDASTLGIASASAESALHLRFQASGGDAGFPADVRLFLSLQEADASLLLRLLVHDTIAVYLLRGERYEALEGVRFTVPLFTGEQVGYENVRSNAGGLRILQHYLTYPDFFKFFSICGLEAAGRISGTADLVIAFKRREQALAGVVKASSIKANCVPALNLFYRRSERITLEAGGAASGAGTYEFHIVPDRTATRDYEAAAVKKIELYNQRNELLGSAFNFYDAPSGPGGKKLIFFSAKRRRKLVARRSTARSSYDGTEVFVSFSSLIEGAYQAAADLLVTNRDLPLFLHQETEFSSSAALVRRAVFAALPTRPDYPLAERGDRGDFSRLSHIVLNLSALLWQEGERPLEYLRNMLRSYPLRPAEEMERLAGGVTALSSTSDTFRFIRKGAVFYEWGWRLNLRLDENAYAGMGFYLFAQVIAETLKSFTPINTILEIRFSTAQSGVIAVWNTLENQ